MSDVWVLSRSYVDNVIQLIDNKCLLFSYGGRSLTLDMLEWKELRGEARNCTYTSRQRHTQPAST